MSFLEMQKSLLCTRHAIPPRYQITMLPQSHQNVKRKYVSATSHTHRLIWMLSSPAALLGHTRTGHSANASLDIVFVRKACGAMNINLLSCPMSNKLTTGILHTRDLACRRTDRQTDRHGQSTSGQRQEMCHTIVNAQRC